MKHLFENFRLAALTLTLIGGTLATPAHDNTTPGIIPGQPPVNGNILARILDAGQRAQYLGVMETNRDTMRDQQKKIVVARKALIDVQLAEKFDEAAFRTLAGEILQAQTELEVLNALAFAKVRPSLTSPALAMINGDLATQAKNNELPGATPGLPPINGLVISRALNDAQRSEYQAVLDVNHDNTLALQNQITATRAMLVEVQLAGRFDEAAFRAHAGEILKAQTELEVLNARAFAKVRSSLTPEQVERFKTSPPLNRPHGGPEARPGVFPMGTTPAPQTQHSATNLQ